MTVARSPAPRAVRRCPRSSSLTALPSAGSASSGLAVVAAAAPSISHSRSTAGSLLSTSAVACSWAAVSRISARAPESLSIHSTCSAEEVS